MQEGSALECGCLIRQVSDVENILGLLQTEVIQVHAEAYDVALDMSFPKGSCFALLPTVANDADIYFKTSRHMA